MRKTPGQTGPPLPASRCRTVADAIPLFTSPLHFFSGGVGNYRNFCRPCRAAAAHVPTAQALTQGQMISEFTSPSSFGFASHVRLFRGHTQRLARADAAERAGSA